MKTCLRVYVSAQTDQGRHYATECMNCEQRPEGYFAPVQDDLNMHILRMFEGTFSFDEAQFCFSFVEGPWQRKRSRTPKEQHLLSSSSISSDDCNPNANMGLRKVL